MSVQPPIRLSVIIVSFNTRQMTLKCLEHLFADLQDLRAEVWIVDNASQDGSVDAIRAAFPSVKLIQNSRNVGFGAANNQAMQRAQGQFVMFLNSDAFVADGTCQRLTDYLEDHPKVGVVGPRLLNPDGSLQLSCFPFPSPVHAWIDNLGLRRALAAWPEIAGYRDWEHDVEKLVPWASGACLVARKEVFVQAGGFDEDFFMYAEETDWQKRIREKGWQVAFLPQVQVVHVGQSSDPANADRVGKVNEQFFTSLDRYELKHHGTHGLLSLRCAMVVGCTSRLVAWSILFLVKRDDQRQTAGRKVRFHTKLLWRQLTRPFPSRPGLRPRSRRSLLRAEKEYSSNHP